MTQLIKDELMKLARAFGEITPTIDIDGNYRDWEDCYMEYEKPYIATLWFNHDGNTTHMVKINL